MNTLLAQLNARAALLQGPLDVSRVEFHISALGPDAGVAANGGISQVDIRGAGVGPGVDLERGRGRTASKPTRLELERLDAARTQATQTTSKVRFLQSFKAWKRY